MKGEEWTRALWISGKTFAFNFSVPSVYLVLSFSMLRGRMETRRESTVRMAKRARIMKETERGFEGGKRATKLITGNFSETRTR